MILHSFISSCLDYCNSLFTCLNQRSLERFHLVQNSFDRLLTRTKYQDHIMPVLALLHWLPVRFRINLKVLLITFKALNGLYPPFITDLFTSYSPSRSLRCSSKGLVVPVARLKTKGDNVFSVRSLGSGMTCQRIRVSCMFIPT